MTPENVRIMQAGVERSIGLDAPVFLIAEIGANHDGDLAQALKLVSLAGEAGFDAVKLQTYTADSLTLSSSNPSVELDPVWGASSLYNLYSEAAMPMDFHGPLVQAILDRGMIPLTTVYDPADLEFVEQFGFPIYKVSSFELNHFELLRELAETNRPLIVSTGAATIEEISETVDFLKTVNSGPVILMQCSSSYPAPPESANLRAVPALKEQFGLNVGYSDHTEGFNVTVAAVAVGACVVEKHFTNDRSRKGPDHRFSLEFSEAKLMVAALRQAESALGSGLKKVESAEEANRLLGKRSIYVAADIRRGEFLTTQNLRVVRPGNGLHPRYFAEALGSRAERDLFAGNPLQPKDFSR